MSYPGYIKYQVYVLTATLGWKAYIFIKFLGKAWEAYLDYASNEPVLCVHTHVAKLSL